jgi:hypothetical protein
LRIEAFGSAVAQEIQLIDLNKLLCSDGTDKRSNQPSYLILLRVDEQPYPIGLVLEAKPTLKRFPQSQFVSQRSEAELEVGFYKHCTTKAQDQSGFQVFLLDPAKICRTV